MTMFATGRVISTDLTDLFMATYSVAGMGAEERMMYLYALDVLDFIENGELEDLSPGSQYMLRRLFRCMKILQNYGRAKAVYCKLMDFLQTLADCFTEEQRLRMMRLGIDIA